MWPQRRRYAPCAEAPFAAGTFRANRRTAGLGRWSSVRIQVLANAGLCSQTQNPLRAAFMKDHLLSFVRGRHGHFRLESGHHGDLWFQLETLFLHARDIRPFAAQLASQRTPNASRIQRARGYIRSSTVSRDLCSQPSKVNASR